jgi:endonuclease/exonuclease/phosphatase family metal-dependent hydrolase
MHTLAMAFRVATLNLEQDHKRWDLRRELVIDQLAALQPDVMAFNEICIPLQTGRWLQRMVRERLGGPYALIQQSKVNGSSLVDGEALLTQYPVVETANWDYRTLDMVAQVVRLDIEGRLLSVFRPTQTAPTAYTPLQDTDGSVLIPIRTGSIAVSITSGWRDP